MNINFKKITKKEKQKIVHNVFKTVANQYDVMNDMMTGGMHHIWKSAMIDWASPPKYNKKYNHLDVAGGTADIAFKIQEKTNNNITSIVYDINKYMLKIGQKRAFNKIYYKNIKFICGNAEFLSFKNNYFDIYTISFGIRNITNIDIALKEAFRVLNFGGRFLCLEVSKMKILGINKIYDFILINLIPNLGKIIVGDANPYKYLIESIYNFPKQDKFAQMISNAGFKKVEYRNYFGGIVAIHSGYKL